jgi:hypothetical protein
MWTTELLSAHLTYITPLAAWPKREEVDFDSA